MLYVDDKFPQHPKLFKAAAKLGPNGGAQALALYMVGLAYAREHLTDGFVPVHLVSACGLVQTPQDVANVLCSRGVRLWHRVPGGYLIHDYLDWNPKASLIKEKRDKWREKKAAQRRGANGQYRGESPGESPWDVRRDSRAPVPRSKYVQGHDRKVPVPLPPNVLTARFASGIVENRKTKTKTKTTTKTGEPTHRVLCDMLRVELAADPSMANAIDGVKRRCARQGFAYPAGDRLDGAVMAFTCSRRKVPA